MKWFKRRTYCLKSYLINHFLYKNIFIEFAVLKGHDDKVTQVSYIELYITCQNVINQTILKEFY